MGIASTTPKQIRTALIPLIVAIVPTAENHRDRGWYYFEEGGDPTELRNFTILQGSFPRESLDGVHGGDGIGYEYPMHIRTGYHGLPEDEIADVVNEDGKDLWLLIHPLPDGAAGTTLAGVLPFTEALTSELVDSEDGYIIVDHIIPIRYKAADS